MEGEWMSSAEALSLLTTVLSPTRAAETLWSWANAELVETRAKRLLIDAPNEKSSQFDCCVPPSFWLRDNLISETWETGDFTAEAFPWGSMRAFGVVFKRTDIEAIAPKDPYPSAVEIGGTQVAGRRQSERWRPWIAELVAYFHEAGVPEGTGSQGQQEVIDAVEDRLASRGEKSLSRSTVQPVVQAVLDRLRSTED